MAVTAESLKAKLEELPASHVEVIDTSGGCGTNFEVVIVSDAFEGKPLLARHRLVNNFLKSELAAIHAFSQKTLTPAEHEKASA